MQEVTKQAVAAVGKSEPKKDWKLEPELHATLMSDKAGPLKRILARPEIREIIKNFVTNDRAAVRSRNLHKDLARWSVRFSLVAILIAAALIVLRTTNLRFDIDYRLVTAVQGFFLITSFSLSLLLAHLKPFETWQKARAAAEHHRQELFRSVVTSYEDYRYNELPLLPLQLEYVRRFLLEEQQAYYRERGAQHASSARQATLLLWLATILVVIAAVPIGLAMFGSNWTDWVNTDEIPAWAKTEDFAQRFFIGLSTAGAAFQGYLAAITLMNQDERNASRYTATYNNLKALSSLPLDEAREAAAAKRREDILTFLALIQEQISSEHREWVLLTSVAPTLSLGALQKSSLPRLG